MRKQLQKIKQNAFYTQWLSKRPILWIALAGVLFLSVFAKFCISMLLASQKQHPFAIQVQTVRVKEASMPEVIDTIGSLTAKQKLK